MTIAISPLRHGSTLLHEPSHRFADGKPMSINESSIESRKEEEVGIAAAAIILGVTRPRLIILLKQGEIPFRMEGDHRMIPMSGILEYQARASGKQGERAPSRDEQRRGLSAMAEFTDALGLGY